MSGNDPALPGRSEMGWPLACALLLSSACVDPVAVDAGTEAATPALDAGPPPPFVEDERWHRQVVFYELWVRSFQDSARTPMQWDATPNAGFTTGSPFLDLAPENDTRNVEVELADESSLLRFYQRWIAIRNRTAALRTGTFQTVPSSPRALVFWRRHPAGDRLVVANYGRTETPVSAAVPWPEVVSEDGESRGTVSDGTWSAGVPPQTVWVLRAP